MAEVAREMASAVVPTVYLRSLQLHSDNIDRVYLDEEVEIKPKTHGVHNVKKKSENFSVRRLVIVKLSVRFV